MPQVDLTTVLLNHPLPNLHFLTNIQCIKIINSNQIEWEHIPNQRLQPHGRLGESWERYLKSEAEMHFQEISSIKYELSAGRTKYSQWS
jgi:hypothetical protein